MLDNDEVEMGCQDGCLCASATMNTKNDRLWFERQILEQLELLE